MVKLPCSPQAVGVAVAEEGGNGFEKLDDEVVVLATLDGSEYGTSELLWMDGPMAEDDAAEELLVPVIAVLANDELEPLDEAAELEASVRRVVPVDNEDEKLLGVNVVLDEVAAADTPSLVDGWK